MRSRYSLQVTISTLFIIIIAILGYLLIELGFQQSDDIMRESAAELYKHVSSELDQDIKDTYDPLKEAMALFNALPAIDGDNFEQRVKALPVLKAMLLTAPSAAAIGVAYDDGDYFSVMHTDSEVMRKKYHVPSGASIMLHYLNKSKEEDEQRGFIFKKNYFYNIFYDKDLNEISRSAGDPSAFDPRLRPWYQALDGAPVGSDARVKPYVFHDSQVVGLTVSNKLSNEVIVHFDITLNSISKTIAKYKKTENSEVVVINSLKDSIAYHNLDELLSKQRANDGDATLNMVKFSQLGKGVLAYVMDNVDYERDSFSFEYAGDEWMGGFVKVGDRDDLFVLMVSPVDELLTDAKATRDSQYLATLLITGFFIPVVWLVAKRISTPLNQLAKEAEAISRFDFSVTEQKPSFIKEVNKLDKAMQLMKSTINKFIGLIDSLAGEQDLDALITRITQETMSISRSDAALIYLMDDQDERLKAHFLCGSDNAELSIENLCTLSLKEAEMLFTDSKSKKSNVIQLDTDTPNILNPLLETLGKDALSCIVLPLKNRKDDVVGMLCLIYRNSGSSSHINNIEFVEALSGFSAVTLESRQSYIAIKNLLDAFVESISNAIDAKSFYTGGHCKRVPELTMMLAEAAKESKEGKYKDFTLSKDKEYELELAGKLHDCGKVTTPVYVVDKATKLETFYDRIHEVRMRFEVLKREAEISCWQAIAEGGDKDTLLATLEEESRVLDDDFAFIAECNIGGEYMSDDKIERLQRISEKKWRRTMDDSLGLSHEELDRREHTQQPLPVEEKLLADKSEHLIQWHERDKDPEEYNYGFNVDMPEYKYNRGELYNLSVRKGTLSEEERYVINGHMIQTIIMLNKLPFPKYLKDIPLLAGSHHETMDGKGYPKKLVMSEQPRRARMMVIADIFEALTASDRPYKKAKTLSESLRIMSFMRNDKHIDADLFDLFLTSGVYLQYAEKHLKDQIDEVNIEDYLSKGEA